MEKEIKEVLELTGFELVQPDEDSSWYELKIKNVSPFAGAELIYEQDIGALYLAILLSKDTDIWSDGEILEKGLYDPLQFLAILNDLNVLNDVALLRFAELLEDFNKIK